jgi:hypothetical protein
LRIGFKTTLEQSLIEGLKIKAVEKGVNVNDIMEKLIDLYLRGKIVIDEKSK